MTDTQSGLETKVGAGDPNSLIGELMGAFEAYKETNDGRLAQLEKRGAVDPLTEDKIAKLNTAPRRPSTRRRSSGPGRGSKPAGLRARGVTPAMSTRRRSPPM